MIKAKPNFYLTLVCAVIFSQQFFMGCENAMPTIPSDPGLAIPSVPSALNAVASDGQVCLSWSASTGATSYQVFYSVGLSTSTAGTLLSVSKINGTSATINNLSNGTSYAFIVVAHNSAGSASSGIITAIPLVPTAAPTAPTGLTATPGNQSVVLSWTASPGATAYRIYYKAGSSATTADSLLPAANINGTSANVSALNNDTQYAFVVIASNTVGDSPASVVVKATPTLGTSDFTLATGNQAIQLMWPSYNGASSYNVYYAPGTTVSAANGTKLSLSATNTTITGLTNGVQYAFAYAPVASGMEGSISTVITGTPGTTPTQFSVNVIQNNATLKWSPVIGNPVYNVYYAIGSSVSNSPANQLHPLYVNGCSAYVSGLNQGTKYTFMVTYMGAIESGGASASVDVLHNLTFTVTAGDSANVIRTENLVIGATSYDLYWSTTIANFTPATGTRISNISLPYTHKGLTNGITYYYILLARAPNSEYRSFYMMSAKPIVLPTPAAPVVRPGIGRAEVKWKSVAGAVAYNLYWSSSPGLTMANGTKIASPGAPPYAVTGLQDGTTYYFLISAVAPGGKEKPSQVSSAKAGFIKGGAGPSGGYLFYDKGSYSASYAGGESWRYLECSSTDVYGAVPWYDKYVLTLKDLSTVLYKEIGYGALNTSKIVTAQTNQGTYAAKLCNDFAYGGYGDWCLPSYYELLELYKLANFGVSDFSGYYWSSTQLSFSHAYGLSTSGNPAISYSADSPMWIRAIRYF